MFFRDLSIKRKLALLVLFACVLALVLAGNGFAVYERANVRSTTLNELSILADTLGENTAAAVSFNDQMTAQQMLRALQGEQHILGARLYDSQGRPFAEYRRVDLGPNFTLPRGARMGCSPARSRLRSSGPCGWRAIRSARLPLFPT